MSGGGPTRARRFEDRRVVVTGAAGGIGGVVADLFRAEGARVVATDVVEADGVQRVDLADDAERDAFVARALEELGGIDVLANVAGLQRFGTLADTTPELMRRHFEVNAVAPVQLVRGFRSALAESRGNVVTVASISAVMGQPYNAAYCASKAAVLLAMKSLAVELASAGIRVNCVSPGGVDTPMPATSAAALQGDVDWKLFDRSVGVIPGFMPPQDIAESVLFVASDAAASMTGANVVVDRGVLI